MVQESLAKKSTSNRFRTFLWFLQCYLQTLYDYLFPFLVRRKDVRNEIVLITGGGSGIGQLMALRFLRLGAKVIVWDINSDGMKQTRLLAEEENFSTEDNLFTFIVDITKSSEVYAASKRVREEIGPVNILINNAGVVSGKNLLDISDANIELTMKVNVLAHFYTIKAFLPEMIEQQKGHIVTIASVAGDVGVCSLSDYCASKFANVGLDLSLRMELAKADLLDKIKTTIVKPYFISTGMFGGAYPGFFPLLKPENVADQIVEAILTEQLQITLPWYLSWIIALLHWFPSKCLVPINDFMGGYEWMANFHGRQEPSKMNGSAKLEINNNHIAK
ncbi:epidermal retinol dehydrogenase 2-like [Sarcoptes scabiei]|nr:epidermal retinol dehydrogenase 2-like [Sarcoptes scabiei]